MQQQQRDGTCTVHRVAVMGYLAGGRAALWDEAQNHSRLMLELGHQGRAHLGSGCLPQHLLIRRCPLICLHASQKNVRADQTYCVQVARNYCIVQMYCRNRATDIRSRQKATQRCLHYRNMLRISRLSSRVEAIRPGLFLKPGYQNRFCGGFLELLWGVSEVKDR